MCLLFDEKQKELAVKVAENSSGKGSISEESIPFRAQDIYSRLHDTGTVISRGQADSNIVMSLLECHLITKMLMAVGGTEGLLTLKQRLQHLRDPRIGVQRLDTVTNILLSLDSLKRQKKAIVIQHQFALIELASKYRKYINSKTRSKIGGKAIQEDNERVPRSDAGSFYTDISRRTVSGEQSSSNKQVAGD
jgi:hypothetical protein